MDHSQFGEQAMIARFFRDTTLPFARFFVDVGAFDGVTGSNSRFLAEQGWGGLAIEPNPQAFARLEALYAGNRRVTCLRCAVSDHSRDDAEMLVAIGPEGVAVENEWHYSQVSTLHAGWADHHREAHGYRYRSVPVRVRPLTELLASHGCPADVGFLGVDCEQEDLKILGAFDFGRFRPRLVGVESEDGNRAEFAALLAAVGYEEYGRTACNTLFRLGDDEAGRGSSLVSSIRSTHRVDAEDEGAAQRAGRRESSGTATELARGVDATQASEATSASAQVDALRVLAKAVEALSALETDWLRARAEADALRARLRDSDVVSGELQREVERMVAAWRIREAQMTERHDELAAELALVRGELALVRGELALVRGELGAAHAATDQARDAGEAARRQLAEIEVSLASAIAGREAAERESRDLQQRFSWRVTAPLRAVLSLIKGR